MSQEKKEKILDYRFTLANERTFLAWMRTALAFMAGAIGIDQLTPNLAPANLRVIIVTLLSLTAAGLAVYGYLRWAKNERAMHLERELPYPYLLIWLSGGLAFALILVLIIMVMM